MPDKNTVWIIIALLGVAAFFLLTKRSTNRTRGTVLGGLRGRKHPTAAELLPILRRLQASNAQWPEILSAVNPRSDPAVQQGLIALRGHHMFIPHVALNVLEHGCERALARNPRASVQDAVGEALSSAHIVVGAGN